MRLTWKEVESVDWSSFSWEDIESLIDLGIVSSEDIEHYYNNEQWRDNEGNEGYHE